MSRRSTDIVPEEQRIENIKKYGEKHYDVIAQSYRKGKLVGDSFCGYTAIKYVERYVGQSKKAGNKMDLIKAVDFITRMIEESELKDEVIEK